MYTHVYIYIYIEREKEREIFVRSFALVLAEASPSGETER